MKKILESKDYQAGGWDLFFQSKGLGWRDKDYRGLSRVFDLSELRGTLLDCGCALGDGFHLLRKLCPKVTRFVGTDFSGEAVERCQRNQLLQGIDFFQHDILKPFPESFDTIICLQTLEHVREPEIAMYNLIAAAKELLIVAVPYRNRRPDENHLWMFDEKDFADLADFHCLDKRGKNIYWLIDKKRSGYSFRGKGVLRSLFAWFRS